MDLLYPVGFPALFSRCMNLLSCGSWVFGLGCTNVVIFLLKIVPHGIFLPWLCISSVPPVQLVAW